jgi:predicted phage terminase large subunit-like protein
MAIQTFKAGDGVWHSLRGRAVTDLYWFNSVVLGLKNLVPMSEREHLFMCQFAEQRTGNDLIDKARYQKIEVPREVGKSSCVTKGFTIQQICKNPNTAILLANEREQNARDFLSYIKSQFETNQLLRALFPEVIPKDLNATTWSASRIIVNRTQHRDSPTLSVIGEGGTVTGMRYDLIIVDDIISREAMENARVSEGNIMERTNRWLHQLDLLLNSNAEPFPRIIFIGTRWWFGDSYEHIEDAFGYGESPRYVAMKAKLTDGSTFELPSTSVYRKGDLAVFRRGGLEFGKPAFPSKWGEERMAKLRVQDPTLFSCNVMNNPADDASATFRNDWLRYYNWLDDKAIQFDDQSGKKRILRAKDLDIMMFVDPGGFSTRMTDERGRAAIIVTGTTSNGEHIILEAHSERESYLNVVNKIIEFASTYEPRKVVIEQAGQQAAFIELVRKTSQEAGIQLYLHPEKPGLKAKEQRVLELEPYFQRGLIYIGRSANFTEFTQQYQQFPRALRIDLLDALAYGPKQWRKNTSQVVMSPQQRRAKELESYYQRRGIKHAT